LKDSNQNTAVLIFSRTEQDEAIQKQFTPANLKSKNRLIAKALIQSTLQTVKKTNLPFYIIDSENQQGNSFGEKFSNAIKTIFNKGFENVITLGNDCPNLSVNNILTAEDNLKFNRTTLGPAKDGGIYLMAINKDSFDFDHFKNLQWQTDRLFSSITEFLSKIGKSTSILVKKADIDSYADLINFLSLSSKNNFKEEIRRILNDVIVEFQINNFTSKKLSFPHQTFGLRAPPFAA